ncbi:MAG TPA: hypothetical protein VFD90_04845 [Gaiellales bacterium]|jgi:hypothetical protein|nr:hypothetical protein [Gaiellales bacterium]
MQIDKQTIMDAAPDRQEVAGQARRATSVAEQNPLGLAVGSVAAGFLVGMLLPSTRIEDERLGSAADDVKEQALEVGQETLEHGEQFAKDAAQTASETAKQSGQEHAEDLRSSVQEHVEEARAESPASP